MMHPMEHLLGSSIPMFVNMVILVYVCHRFLAATRLRRKIIAEMREYATIVRRARENLGYIGEQVSKGMIEIEEDIGKELRITQRLTAQNAKVDAMLQRFANLEENVIELVRMDRDRESVRVETPKNVGEEVEKILAAYESRRNAENPEQEIGGSDDWRRERVRDGGPRNPLSKFSACNPRDARRTIDGRARIATTPEVRLLDEVNRPTTPAGETNREP